MRNYKKNGISALTRKIKEIVIFPLPGEFSGSCISSLEIGRTDIAKEY